jgi:hypothetical protein
LIRRGGTRGGGRVVALLLLAMLVGGSLPVGAGASPARGSIGIPVGLDGGFLSNLSAPVLGPGGSGAIGMRLSNPLDAPLILLAVTLELYAFSPAPGGVSGAPPAGGVDLDGPNGSTNLVRLHWASLNPGATTSSTVTVRAEGGAPLGSYLLRTELSFQSNGSSYRFESRGFFSATLWGQATLPNGPDGTPSLNLTTLGVDGITPETAVGVLADGFVLPIYGLTAVGLALATVGGYLYWRRGPGSSSGAEAPVDPHKAPSAFGKKRTSDGERNNS